MRVNELSSVPYNKELNPLLWGKKQLKPKIRYKLLFIAQHFAHFLNVPKLNLRDITISGSNAAYGYSENSDLDLHLVVDIPKDRPELIELYDAKKNHYNSKFDIKIKSIPVELYVQDNEQVHTSAGIYSVLHDTWIKEPKHQAPRISEQEVKSKARNYAGHINQALKSKDIRLAQQTMDDIRRLRKAGLEKGGEFSVENLAFKLLRSRGQIDKLRRHIDKLQSAELSIGEMSMRGPDLSTLAQRFADENKQRWLSRGKHVGDIENFKVLQDGIYYSLWDDDKLVAAASLSNSTNEVDDVWVDPEYRGRKIFSMMLWFFKTRLNRNILLLGPIHSKDMQEVVKGLSRFDKKWYNIVTNKIEPFNINTLDNYYSHMSPTQWRLMLENTGNFNFPMFNQGGFVKDSYETYIE